MITTRSVLVRLSKTWTLSLGLASAALIGAGCDTAAEVEAAPQADAAAAVAVDASGEAKVAVEGDAAVEPSMAAKVIDEAQAAAEIATFEATITAEALDLEGISALIKKGKVKDAAALEASINSRKGKLASVDIDGDGTVDFVQVVEVRSGADVNFELRVVPSSKKETSAAVLVAVIAVAPDPATSKVTVRATYTAVVQHHEIYVYEYSVPATFEGDVVIVAGNPFFGWVYSVNHEVYVGTYTHETWVATPGVVIVIGADGCWPPGHCKHGKHKGKYKGKGKYYYGGKGGKKGKKGHHVRWP